MSITKARRSKAGGSGQTPQMLLGGASIMTTYREVIDDLDKSSFGGVEETGD